jgi:hypothetical protein
MSPLNNDTCYFSKSAVSRPWLISKYSRHILEGYRSTKYIRNILLHSICGDNFSPFNQHNAMVPQKVKQR